MQIRPFKIKISVFSWELFSVFNGFLLDPDPQPPFCFSLACYFFLEVGGMLAPILRTVLRILIRMDPELCLDQDPELLFRIKIQQ